ncbi:PEP-CTERM sorting domain-containing protein [Aquabacterium sp. OR-4]|uniref:PEP-CTERM sorting domain-containing protein n=1 Tax=Aquabacterium sp. OR-4 TaxID=2978127 RepID=UPI0021B4484B|nr:PEP-CTERM sorting domain-containing protein [Aquabacterium sp. OR-4]MDT7838541.1 PEP-CTERM sorting domain-containing protein [Aquabacterium sp. OR-4]
MPQRPSTTARRRPTLPGALALAATLLAGSAMAAPVNLLFVGNSYTFGRLDPVLTYNAAQVRDLTQPQGALHGGRDPSLAFTTGAPFTNLTGTNSYPVGTINPATGAEFTSYSPHSQSVAWGGVPGIFKQFTVQAGLDYNVSLSTRNAASLRGHFLNTANSNWDLRGNIGSQRWDQVVLQEQSDEALPPKTVGGVALGSNNPAFTAYANVIENWVHQGTSLSYTERAMYEGLYGSVAGCVAAGGTTASCGNTTTRNIAANGNANADAQIWLMQPWARPNIINAPGTNLIDPRSGDAIYNPTNPARSYYDSLEAMTDDNAAAYLRALDVADNDGSGGFAGIAPVGQAFLRAVSSGVATRDMYGAGAATDGLIDLWFNDGTHASVAGSYLSALTLFGSLTGLDPAMLGAGEVAARELGLSAAAALQLQRVASDQLGFSAPVPEPGTLALWLLGLAGVGLAAGRRHAAVR